MSFCLVANKSTVKIEILVLELKYLKKNTINHKACVSGKIRENWSSLCVCVWCVYFFQCICVRECGICCDGMFRFDHFHIIFIGRIFTKWVSLKFYQWHPLLCMCYGFTLFFSVNIVCCCHIFFITTLFRRSNWCHHLSPPRDNVCLPHMIDLDGHVCTSVCSKHVSDLPLAIYF